MRITDPIPEQPLSRRLEALGFPLSGQPLADLAVYLGRLMKWNKSMNLVGTASWEETLDTLVVDSFHLARFLPSLALPAAPISWDLGSGAGLPGIPLRILWRNGSYTLVEAREKRALFMRTILAGIDLGDTQVFHGRAEVFFREAGLADLMLSRAFMPWRDMLTFIENSLAPNGKVVFLTLTPAPRDLPSPWRLEAESAYTADGKERWFWCLGREQA